MFSVTVKHDLDRMISRLTDLQTKHVPFATARALTWTAQDVKDAERKEIERVFDRPTPWTLNSLFIKPATARQLSALVWLKDEASKGTPAATYLHPEVFGGARVQKRFERALQYAGVLPKGMFAVPGSAAKVDAYGNMSSGQIVQILSQLRAQATAGYESRIGGAAFDKKKVARAVKRQGYRIFALQKRHGKLLPGIYARYQFAHGTSVKPLMIFVKGAPKYRVRFQFFEVAERVSLARFPLHFQVSLAQAVGG